MAQAKTYKACKRTVLWFFVFAFALHTAFKSGLKAISGFAPQNVLIIIDMTWASLIIVAVTVFPIYVLVAKYEVTQDNVRLRKGFILFSHQLVPLSSVMSVTTVTTPLSVLTGFNFVVLNSPGSKSIMPFVTTRQAKEVSKMIEDEIQRQVTGEDAQ